MADLSLESRMGGLITSMGNIGYGQRHSERRYGMTLRNAENGMVRTESKNLVNRGEARDPSSEATTVLAKSGTYFPFQPLRMTAWGGLRHSLFRAVWNDR